MVSKNNLKYYEQRHALYQKPHFGLRKLSIGVASVLLSTTFFLGEAHADEVTGPESNNENLVTLNNNYNSVNSVGIAQYSTQSSVQGQNSQQPVSVGSSNPIDVESLNVQNVPTGNSISSNASMNYLNNMKYQSLNRVNNSVDMNTDMYNSNLDNSQVQTDPVTTKAVYNSNEDVQIYDRISNNTAQDQNFTTEMGVYDADQPILFQTSSNYLKSGSSIDVDNNSDLRNALKIPHNILEPNHGYLVKVNVYDQASKLLSSKSLGLSVEDNWKVFPKYGVVAGSGDYGNSIINNSDLINRYKDQMQEMARMHINSDFYYDVYKSPANPLPETTSPFQQTWSWWSGPNGSTIDPEVVKNLVRIGHDYNQSAMIYNMISAKTNDETPNNTPGLPDDSQLVYNFNDGAFGKKGTPMTNTMKAGDPYIAQIYYNPASPSWINYISDTMASAINRGGFDGWQGDTIGDAQVTTVENKGTNDSSKSFNMSDTYAYFSDQLKKNWKNHGYNYDFTLNAVGGNGLIDLSKNEDVAYVEVWPNSSYDGRNTSEYGDLKWMVDKVRQASGKSLIIAAYLKNNQIVDGKFNTNAQLLVDATVAAAGGYHMTVAANGNSKDGNHVGILDNEYYPNQEAGVSDDLNRKLYNYQQFITSYENILRGSGVENDDTIAKAFDANGHQMSRDDNSSRDSGRNGNQVWTFTKHGPGFETIQLINLMGINSDWDNTSKNNNKNPVAQHNFTVRYPLNNMPADQAKLIANNVYVMSPDDWNHGTMQKIDSYVDQSNGNYDLVMKVPTLDIWDMIYFKTSALTNQLVHYEYKDGDSLLATGTSNVSIENGQYNFSKLTPPSGYKIKNNFVPVDASNMLVSIPVEKLPVVKDTINIVDVDDNNKVLSSQTVASLPSNYDNLVPANYRLAGYNLKDTTLTIRVRHQTKAVKENKPVVRHVTIVSPNGQTNSFDQKVVFGRAGVYDLVTGKTNWSVWDPASGVLDAVNVPVLPGYTRSGQINAITVTPDSQDSSVTVTYKKIIQSDSTSSSASQSGSASSSSTTVPSAKYSVDVIDLDENNKTVISNQIDKIPDDYRQLVPANYTLASYHISGQTLTLQVHHEIQSQLDNHTVTRTVDMVWPTGHHEYNTQQVTFSRTGYKDMVTGKTKWTDWQSDNDTFKAVKPKEFPGYTINGSAGAVTVKPDAKDSTVVITYSKISNSSQASSSLVTPPVVKYTIDILDVDESNKTLSSNQVVKLPASYDNLIPTNYSLVGYSINGQTLTIKVRHNIKAVKDSKTVTRNIVIIDPTGHRQEAPQSVTFGRAGIQDLVTGKTTWKAWDPSSETFDAIRTPDFTGYIKHGSIDKVMVTPDSKDSTVTVTYTKNETGHGSSASSQTSNVGSSSSGATSSTNSSTASSSSGQTSSGSVVSPTIKFVVDVIDVDENNKTLTSNEVDHLPSSYDNLIPINYSLAGYNIKGQTLTIKVRHNVKAVTENKTVTRNIVIIDPTGHRQEGPQSVTFGRAGVKDLVTGQTNWKPWDPASAAFDTISTPDFPGYTKHGSVDKVVVTPDSQDSTVTITYTRNDSGSHSDSQTSSASSSASGQTSSASSTASSVTSSASSSAASSGSSQTSSGSIVSPTVKFVVDVIDVDENDKTLSSNEVDHLPSSYDSLVPTNYSLAGYDIKGQTSTIKVRHNVKSVTEDKTVTRNIVIVDPTGHRQTGQQQVTFGRAGLKDLVTGQTSWKAWDPANSLFDAISTPDFPGYTKHGSVDKVVVTPDSQDSTVTITYTRNDSGSHSGSQTSSAGSSTASSTQSSGSTASSASSNASSSTSSTSSSAGSSSSSQTSSGSVVSPTVKFVVDVLDVDENNKTLSSNEVDHLPSSYDSLIPKNYSLAGYSIKDQMLTIKVRHDVKTVTENKTVTRHIVMIDPFGRRQTGDQSVTFGRAGVQDLVTGNTTWKAWDPESYQFNAVNMPDFVGYKPSINVNAITVTPDSKDVTMTVTYTKTGSDSNLPGSSTASSANSSVTSSAMLSTVSSTTSSTVSSTMSSTQNSSVVSSVSSATTSNIDSNTSSVQSSVASSTASSVDSSVVLSTQSSAISSANSRVSSSVIISSANSENSSQASSSVINSDVNNSGVNSITSQKSQVDNISNSVSSSVVIGSNSLTTVNSQTDQQSEINQSLNSIVNSVSSFNDAGNQNTQADSNVEAVQNNAGQVTNILQKVQPSVTINANGGSTMTVPLGAVVNGRTINTAGTVNNQAEAGQNDQSTGSAGLPQMGKSDQDRAMAELGLAGEMFVLGLAGTNKKLRKKRQ